MKRSKAYFRGCLLGGAIGDALAFPFRTADATELADAMTDGKMTDLICHDAIGRALVSDDTQLMAFTADGMIWADKRAHEKGVYAYVPSVFYGYQKWYYTQTGHFAQMIDIDFRGVTCHGRSQSPQVGATRAQETVPEPRNAAQFQIGRAHV